MAELSGKVRKLFDGHADGIIDDRNYEMLMKDIQAEQESLEQKLSALQSKISQQHNFLDISILRCKIVLSVIKFFGHAHSAYFLKKA